jgi:hypothetical protein
MSLCADSIGSRRSKSSIARSASLNSRQASFSPQVIARDPRDQHVHVVVVGDEHAVNRESPERQLAEFPEGAGSAPTS